MSKVLLFGGTTEGRMIAEILSDNKIECDVCVATEYGEMVMEEMPFVRVMTGRLSCVEMAALVQNGGYDAVIDATHPFAVEVSANIRKSVAYAVFCGASDRCDGEPVEKVAAVAEKSGVLSLPLIRYERNMDVSENYDSCEFFDDVPSCILALARTEGKILLTTGSKELGDFCECESIKSRLVARVLPGMESLRLCYDAGLTGKQIIAMQGPFSEQMNRTIIEEYGISVLVMKESGKTGGADEKIRAAKAAGIGCYVIRRPRILDDADVSTVGQDSSELSGVALDSSKESAFAFVEADNSSASHESAFQNYCVVSSIGELCRTLEKCLSGSVTWRISLHVSLAGIGPGGTDFMTAAVRTRLAEADCVFGAPRMLSSVHVKGFEADGTETRSDNANCASEKYIGEKCATYPYYLASDILPVLEDLRQKAAETSESANYARVLRAVVLFSGDPGFFSGAEKLKEALSALPDATVEILPGISSIQYLASKLGRNWQNADIISMHGVPEEKWLPAVDSAVSAGREVFFLTSGAADIRRLGSFLVSLRRSGGVSEYAVHVGFQLSYPDEVVKTLTPEECMEIDGQGLWCGMLIPKKGN